MKLLAALGGSVAVAICLTFIAGIGYLIDYLFDSVGQPGDGFMNKYMFYLSKGLKTIIIAIICSAVIYCIVEALAIFWTFIITIFI